MPVSIDDRITEVLVALKEGLGAAAGLFDDDRGTIYLSSEPSAALFWEQLQELDCLRTDWAAWYQELRLSKRLITTCSCSLTHTVYCVLLHERWALLVMAHGPRLLVAERVVTSALKVLADLLPKRRARLPPLGGGGRGGGGGGPDEARVGIPLWWVRKAPS